MSKVSRLEQKVLDCFESKNYYEAHQVYRTLYYRMSSQQKWKELQDILYDGALRLMNVNEPTSAVDLAELYVDVLTKSQTPVSPETLQRFEKLFTSLPSTLENDTASDGQKVDRRSQLLAFGLKWTQNVSGKKRYKERGHADFHSCVANVLWREGNYCAARSHFMLTNDPKKFAEFLVDFYQKHGEENEKDLFVVQAVLQLLCNRRPRMASNLLREYCIKHPDIGGHPPYKLPLLNFSWLLMLSIRLKKIQYFTILVEKYSLERDPSYLRYVDRIAQVYFNAPAPKKQCGFLGTFIKGLVSSAQTNESAAQSSSEETNIISEDEQFEELPVGEEEFLKAAEAAEKFAPPVRPSVPAAFHAESVPIAQPPSPPVAQATDDMDLD